MLGNAFFSYNTLRKYWAAFGTVFNDITVERRDANGVLQQTVTVPLSYARKEKILARLEADPTLENNVAITLPRMSFEMSSMDYDSSRKLRSTREHNRKYANTAGNYSQVLHPVPYDLHFNLYVYTKYQHDGNQIIEQILPFFQPQFDMTIELIPEMDIVVDSPIVFNGIPRNEDNWDGDYRDRRAIVWTLPFTMKAYLFGPTRVHPVIKFANVNMYNSTTFDTITDAVGNSQPIDRVTVQPGQDANGNATSNLTITVPYSQIERDEEWDYITVIYGDLDPSEGSGGE